MELSTLERLEEVDGVYWFGPVRPSACLSICLSFRYACTRSKTVRKKFLKFNVWDEYEN